MRTSSGIARFMISTAVTIIVIAVVDAVAAEPQPTPPSRGQIPDSSLQQQQDDAQPTLSDTVAAPGQPLADTVTNRTSSGPQPTSPGQDQALEPPSQPAPGIPLTSTVINLPSMAESAQPQQEDVQLTLSATVATPGQPITVTVRNVTTSTIATFDSQSLCWIFFIQQRSGENWENVLECPAGKRVDPVAILPGGSESLTFNGGSNPFDPGRLNPGAYRVEFLYKRITEISDLVNDQIPWQTVFSPIFTIEPIVPGPTVPGPGSQILEIQGPFVSAPVKPFVFDGDLRKQSTVGSSKPLEITPAQFSPPNPNFDGIFNPAGGTIHPPDTVGDVGPNHYIQMVNSPSPTGTLFAIFGKAGNLLAGPAPFNTLWTAVGGLCSTSGTGDAVVVYDHLADRWLLSQFAFVGLFNPPLHHCIAISRTPDPVAGGWFLYDFVVPNVVPVNDYPKFGVWPDAYYMATQRGYLAGMTFGFDAWAFDRANMLNGTPATFIRFFDPGAFSLPSDLDGATPPPAGAPNVFARLVDGAEFGGVDRLQLRAFSVNFAVPASSTFTPLPDLPTAAFDRNLCGLGLGGTCIPQPGITQRLDSSTAWLMYRLQYRNFGTYETLVVNHTVDVDGTDHAGIRWYELRRTSGAWSIFQQGAYAPDANHRWMGSIAMDKDGNMALGYSVSSNIVSPSIRYAGRLAGDPLGTMPQGEFTLFAGNGSQTSFFARWGDYSAMTVDPVDDCTFWYTSEYYQATSFAGWRTRIGAFRFASCDADLSIAKTDSPDPVLPGTNLTYNLTVTNNGPSASTGVVMTDTLPTGVTFVSATPSQGTCSLSGSIVTCNLGDLANGTNATVTIVVTVNSSTPCGTTLSNTAEVRSNLSDSNPSNNTASADTVVICQADLSITKTDSPDPVKAGHILTYTIEVVNNGPSAASDVMMTDTLSGNVTFVSAAPSQGSCTQASGIVTCSLGNLASGASAMVTIVVTPEAGCEIINVANATANEADPNTTNNRAATRTTVVLDDFNRPDGHLGRNWRGQTEGYRIVSDQVVVRAGGPIYWQPAAYGTDQEACVTLTRIDPRSKQHALMLKVQELNDWRQGAILVSYNARSGNVEVEARDVGNNKWILVGSFTPPTPVVDGDQLRAQAFADGKVEVFINDTSLGIADAGSFYTNKGGQIGLWFRGTQEDDEDDEDSNDDRNRLVQAREKDDEEDDDGDGLPAARRALLDDFGGGTIPPIPSCLDSQALTANAPGVSVPNPATLLSAVSIVNDGTAAAENVQVTSIGLNGGVLTSPAFLPVNLGTIPVNGVAVLDTDFSGGPFIPGGIYALAVSGTYAAGTVTYCFTFNVDLIVPPAAPGSAAVSTASVEAHEVTGAPFPPQPPSFDEDETNPSGWTVPTGPLVPGTPTPNTTVTQRAPVGAQITPQQAGVVVFTGNHPVGITNGSTIAEPSGASGGGVVFITANWFAAYSTDGGVTFTRLNPTTVFPNDAVGFCCDQIVQYMPSIDRFIWFLQGNGYRLASASPADIINSGGTAWTYWNLTPGVFGSCGGFDYPDLSVGNNFLYMSWDAGFGGCTGGFQVARTSFAGIQAAGTITVEFTDPANGGMAWGSHLSQDTGDEIFWAGHNNNSQMRIFSLQEGSSTYFWRDRGISSWANNAPTSTTPDGLDWLCKNFNGCTGGGAFPRNGVIGATRSFSQIWFAWTAGTNDFFQQPHVEMVTLDRNNNFNVTEQVQIWNNSYAFAYPALATNACTGEVGLSLEYGGNGNYENHVVGFWGDFVVYITTATNVGTTRFGDYVTIRQQPASEANPGNLFDAFGYGLNSVPSSGTQVDIRYVSFGRPASSCIGITASGLGRRSSNAPPAQATTKYPGEGGISLRREKSLNH